MFLCTLANSFKYIPFTKDTSNAEIEQSIRRFRNRIRWKYIFRKSKKPMSAYYIKKDKDARPCHPAVESYIEDTTDAIHGLMRLHPPQSKPSHFGKLQTFLRTNNLIVKPTDKNLGLCVMSRKWYEDEVLRQLRNSEVYEEEPMVEAELKQQVRNKLVIALQKMKINIFSEEHQFIMHKRLERKLPMFYIIPKIHKQPIVGRPIVASTNWLTTNLSLWVCEELKPFMNLCPFVLKDSQSLLVQLRNQRRPLERCSLVTIDVVSLYTNMDIAQVTTILQQMLPERRDIIIAIEFILRNNYFIFKDKTYRQKNGMAMGTNMAVLVANLFVAGILDNRLYREASSFRNNIRFYRRYIDDIFMLWSGSMEELARFKRLIEHLARPLKFTLNVQQESIPFLDIEFFWDHDHLHHKVYQKPMNRYLYIPYSSNHPPACKTGFIKGELIRYARLCSRETDFLEMKSLLMYRLKNRGYPVRFLRHVMSQVSYESQQGRLPNTGTDQAPKPDVVAFAIPFSPRIRRMNVAKTIHAYEGQLKETFPGFFGSTKFLVAYKSQSSLGNQLIKTDFK